MQPHQHHESDDSPDRAEHPLAPVCNVFEAFLNTDNVTVFANAAIDCILCLLKFVRGGSELRMMYCNNNIWIQFFRKCDKKKTKIVDI